MQRCTQMYQRKGERKTIQHTGLKPFHGLAAVCGTGCHDKQERYSVVFHSVPSEWQQWLQNIPVQQWLMNERVHCG